MILKLTLGTRASLCWFRFNFGRFLRQHLWPIPPPLLFVPGSFDLVKYFMFEVFELILASILCREWIFCLDLILCLRIFEPSFIIVA